MKLSLYRRTDASIVAMPEMFLPPGAVGAAGPYVFLGYVRTEDAAMENECRPWTDLEFSCHPGAVCSI